jgi:hypothetical protein
MHSLLPPQSELRLSWGWQYRWLRCNGLPG